MNSLLLLSVADWIEQNENRQTLAMSLSLYRSAISASMRARSRSISRTRCSACSLRRCSSLASSVLEETADVTADPEEAIADAMSRARVERLADRLLTTLSGG
jgi:hypothetical protein